MCWLYLRISDLVFMVLTDMVSRKRVFPTKTSGWVTLACKPMIADSANLEKIFKSHGSVCLLNLPSAAKRAANKSRHEGNVCAVYHDSCIVIH